MDVDTRLLRYFAVVAEEAHLTRAAERLFISQPALTKQIKQLEAQLGVELFTRSRTGMALTEAGHALAERVPGVLEEWDRALRDTRGAAGRAARVLRVGFVASAANESTQAIIGSFARRRPGWRVEMRQTDWSDPTAGLADGQVDVALLRLPFPGQDGLRVEVLITEPRWVALAASHPLAESAEIPFRALWDEPFVATPPESGWWRDYWLAVDERGGRPVTIGVVARNPDEWLTAIASGYGVSLTPEATARFYQRPGVVYRPVTGVSPSRVGVAWAPAADGDAVVRDFVRACLEELREGRTRIRAARAGDLPLLQDVERAAGQPFREMGMVEVAEDDPPSLAELTEYQRAGAAWVAVGADDRPVAYLVADRVDGCLHVEQVSVHPAQARRGVGRSLLEHLAEVARGEGVPALTLTTFADVPWNAPYYERCGFRRLGEDELTPGLRAVREREAAHGLDRWERVCMRRDL